VNVQHYQYTNVVAEDARRYRTAQRIDGPAQWAAEHGGACPYCGSHDGMKDLYPWNLRELAGTYYRRDGIVYVQCPYCESDTGKYTKMSHDEVRAWLEQEEQYV